jgi:hypothetical protein
MSLNLNLKLITDNIVRLFLPEGLVEFGGKGEAETPIKKIKH